MRGEIAIAEIDAKSQEVIQLAKDIWANPETAMREKTACRLIRDLLEKEGFQVEVGCAGVPTAIRAQWGSGKPVIGFLGEFDALEGMSQKVSTVKEPLEAGAAGHGCGHNLISPACIAAILGMRREMEEKHLTGTLVFYGCPCEEGGAGKVFMARGGAFRDLDIGIAWHPFSMNFVGKGKGTATNHAKFHFKGISAHAGDEPHNGRSALDAAELMNVGVNYLREHVPTDVRIHYAYEDVNHAPNVVPDKATTWYYIRAHSRETVEDVYQRVVRIAKGAAMMTDTQVQVEFLSGYSETLANDVITDTIFEVMKEVPLPEWTEEELKFAEELDKTSPIYGKMLASGRIKPGTHIHSEVPAEIIYKNSGASTDLSDVQHVAPVSMFMTACSNIGAMGHSWHNVACYGHSIGMKGMLHGAKVAAVTGLRFLQEPELLAKAQAEFLQRTGGKPYVCPIPDDVPVPHPED